MKLIYLSFLLSQASASIVLSRELMSLATTSAELSSMAYDGIPVSDDHGSIVLYNDEPDQALFAKRSIDGQDFCFIAFRGTTPSLGDWIENVDFTSRDVCVALGNETQCCTTRDGFYDAFFLPTYLLDLEKKVRECARTCENKDKCVVLTGFSQGGAVAAVAALFFADLNPHVFTFGQPNAIFSPCPLITSDRWFRFINTLSTESGGIFYDPVPFAPGMGADAFGHMIILGDDVTSVAYIGLDAQDFFWPLTDTDVHTIIGTESSPGYFYRLEAVITNNTFPVQTNGFVAESFCSQDKECASNMCAPESINSFSKCLGTQCDTNLDCEPDRCELNLCVPKMGSCQQCNEPSDCTSGKCWMSKCSNEKGFMDDNCNCMWDSDCESGRCDGFTMPLCRAKQGLGASCNESSDCESNYCSWFFVCREK